MNNKRGQVGYHCRLGRNPMKPVRTSIGSITDSLPIGKRKRFLIHQAFRSQFGSVE